MTVHMYIVSISHFKHLQIYVVFAPPPLLPLMLISALLPELTFCSASSLVMSSLLSALQWDVNFSTKVSTRLGGRWVGQEEGSGGAGTYIGGKGWGRRREVVGQVGGKGWGR